MKIDTTDLIAYLIIALCFVLPLVKAFSKRARNRRSYMRSPEWKTKRNAHLVERKLKGQRIG